MKLEFHPEARAEGLEAFDWYREHDLRAADAFFAELETVAELARANPLRWPIWRRDFRRVVFPRFPYSLFYVAEPSQVIALAVAHAKRRPGYWMHRAR